MTIREWQKLAKEHLLPHFPGMTLSGRWMLYAPIGWQVRGFAFEPSGFDKLEFTVYAGVLPLYVPQTPGLTFTERIGWLAKRQRGDVWWNLGQASADEVFADIRQRIQQDAIPYLTQRATVEGMTKICHHQIIHSSDDRYIFRAMLCAGILLDDSHVVEREWQHFTAYHAKYAAPDSPEWVASLFQVTERIYQQFLADPASVREEIARWRQERAAELKFSPILADAPDDLRDATRPRLRWFVRKGE